MRIGASTLYALNSKSLLEASEELYYNGIDVVELVCEYPHSNLSRDEAENIGRMGMDCSVHLPYSGVMFAHPNPEIRKPGTEMVEKNLETAEMIGARECVMHGGWLPCIYLNVDMPKKKDIFYKIFMEEFGKIFEKAGKNGMRLLLENVSKDEELFGSYADMAYVKERLPGAGVCLDIAHALRRGELDLYIENLPVDHVHVSDSRLGGDDHLPIGRGQLPVKEALKKLEERGYKGKVIFEGRKWDGLLESVERLKEMVG